MSLPRDLIEQDWFRTDRDLQPGLLPDRGRALARHHGLGRAGARARLRLRASLFGVARGVRRGDGAADPAGADVSAFADVARAVAWRQIHNFTHEPRVPPAVAHLPAVLLHRLRRRALERGRRARASTSRRATRPSSSCSSCCRRRRSAACSRASRSPRTSSAGFARRLMLAAPDRRGILAGYALAALVRALIVGMLLFASRSRRACRSAEEASTRRAVVLALLVNLAALLFAAGVAMRLRTIQAGPRDADAGLHRALPGARLRAARPAVGLGRRGGAAQSASPSWWRAAAT